jgi:hypothetical protein
MLVPPFIQRWQNSAAAERANYQLFLSELCDYLEVPRPDPAVGDTRHDDYVFERPVTFRHPNGLTSSGFIDLYKRGCFVLEAKRGTPVPDANLLFEPIRRRGAVRKSGPTSSEKGYSLKSLREMRQEGRDGRE